MPRQGLRRDSALSDSGVEPQRVCAYVKSSGLQAPSTTLSLSLLPQVARGRLIHQVRLTFGACGECSRAASGKYNAGRNAPTTSYRTPAKERGQRSTANSATVEPAGLQAPTAPPTTPLAPLLSHCWDLHRARCVMVSLTRVNVNRTAAIWSESAAPQSGNLQYNASLPAVLARQRSRSTLLTPSPSFPGLDA